MEVSIIGTGTMATGIAQVFSLSNQISKINIIGRTEAKALTLKNSCEKNILRLTQKGKISVNLGELAIHKIHCSVEYSTVTNSDLIIEAVAENLAAKMILFSNLSEFITNSTIVASNTSSLSITAFAAVLPFPQKVVGLHFFNPAPIMELVEIVVGHETDTLVIAELQALMKELGKSSVVVQEAPGFVVNRMLIPLINEAIFILSEGVANREDIDKSMMLGAHHPMGPLKLADLIGNDVVLSIMDVLYQETADSKFRAAPLLRKMVRAKHLGKKTKMGFYSY